MELESTTKRVETFCSIQLSYDGIFGALTQIRTEDTALQKRGFSNYNYQGTSFILRFGAPTQI